MRPMRYAGLPNILKTIASGLATSAACFWMILAVSPGCGCLFSPVDAEAQQEDTIVYIRSGRDAFTATLVPDPASGSVPQDPALVEATANRKPVAVQLAAGQDGAVEVNGTLPGLTDGRHRGTVTTLTPDGPRKDRKQLLIMVDSQPPTIERVAPEGDLFPRGAGAVRFHITDPGDGSGVAVDPAACGLDVVVQGAALQDTCLSYDENVLSLSVFLAFPDGAAPHDASFSVTVAVQDRAGNVGRATETFQVRSPTPPVFTIYACKGLETYIETEGEFLVEPVFSAMALTAGTDRQLDVVTRGSFGKDYVYPDKVRELMRRWEGVDRATEAEVVSLNTFFQKIVGERVEIQSTSDILTVHKLEDRDFKDSRVSFSIRQNNPAMMGDQVSDLLVTVPVSFHIDPSKVDFCEAQQQRDRYDSEDNTYDHIPEDAFIFTFETITVPVYLETAAQPFALMVEQEDDQLTARVRLSPIELMDTAASWFAFQGDTYWFERQGDACVAKGPAREGTIHYEVGVAHRIAEFLDPEGGAASRTMRTEGDIVVCLDPPRIEGLRYDRQTNRLQAAISDEGTPPEALSIELEIAGFRPETTFDPRTGELTADLSFTPVSVLTATVAVTDLAGQTTREACTIFGDAEKEDDSDTSATEMANHPRTAVRGPYTSPRSYYMKDVEQILGTTAAGKALVQVCEDVMQWGYHAEGAFVPLGRGARSMRLVQVRPLDAEQVYTIGRALSEDLPLRVEVLGTHYDRALYAPLPSGRGVTSLTVTGGYGTSDATLRLYLLVTAQKGNRRIPITDACSYGMGFSYQAVKECRVEERDILPPVIDAAYDAGSGLLNAAIHDHGMPLSQLEVDFTARSDTSRSDVVWGAGYARNTEGGRPPFTFRNGVFASRFTPPPDQGEFFVLRLGAEDKAGNRSHVLIDVVVPREPPEVSLAVETRQPHQVSSRGGEEASVYLTAEARDDSGIVPEQTTLWLDGQVLAPFYRYSHLADTSWNDRFHFNALYLSGLEEGAHLARFRATDALGLRAETTAPFDFELAPFIYNFKVMPDAVQNSGGPALTAMILDLGGDLDIDGLALTIDGEAVDTSMLYYDPDSGYFAVEGPLALSDGQHVAAVTATDSRGNRAEDALRFTRASDITAFSRMDGQVLAIDSLTLMELEDHNGDGRANPGELVRLFITLHNGADQTSPCSGRLSSEDVDIVVETEELRFDAIGLDAMASARGFDVRIGRDVLEKTISDPYEAYFNLRVTCAPDPERVLPLALPIYTPTIPGSGGMTLNLDRLPPTTTAGTYRVEGTVASSTSMIDWMEIRVNGVLQGAVSFDREGGRFTADVNLAEGANTIEATGVDGAGMRGAASGFIYRTVSFRPPSITITSPGSGDRYQCNDLRVTGTYRTGSGSLGEIRVDAPWAGGSCPVTIIDDAHFTVECGNVLYGPRGHYDIEAVIRTSDGAEAVDTLTIFVESCS